MSRERIMLTQAIPAVQQLRRVQGFNPLRFLKRNANGGIELEPRYQRLWFRLACPDGKMLLNRLRITDQIAVYEAQVFLSREDNQPIANFTAAVEKAQAPAGRYVQAAQDAALKGSSNLDADIRAAVDKLKAQTKPHWFKQTPNEPQDEGQNSRKVVVPKPNNSKTAPGSDPTVADFAMMDYMARMELKAKNPTLFADLCAKNRAAARQIF